MWQPLAPWWRPVSPLLSWLGADVSVGFIYRIMSPLPSRYSLPTQLCLPQLFQVSQRQGSAFCVQPLLLRKRKVTVMEQAPWGAAEGLVCHWDQWWSHEDPGGVHPTKQSMWTAVIPALFVGCVATHSGNTPNTAAELDKAEVRCWATPGSWRNWTTGAYLQVRAIKQNGYYITYNELWNNSGARKPMLCAKCSSSNWLNPDSNLYHTDLIEISMVCWTDCRSDWGTQRLMTLLSQILSSLPSRRQASNFSCQQALTF